MKHGGEAGVNERRLWHGTARAPPATVLEVNPISIAIIIIIQQHNTRTRARFHITMAIGWPSSGFTRPPHQERTIRWSFLSISLHSSLTTVTPRDCRPARARARPTFLTRRLLRRGALPRPECTLLERRSLRPPRGRRVAPLGESFDFGEAIHRDIKRPPAESSGVFYDSVRGGPHRPSHTGVGDNDSPMFVLCDLAQTRLSWSCVKRCCAASCGVLSGGIAGPRYTRNTTNAATIRVCVCGCSCSRLGCYAGSLIRPASSRRCPRSPPPLQAYPEEYVVSFERVVLAARRVGSVSNEPAPLPPPGPPHLPPADEPPNNAGPSRRRFPSPLRPSRAPPC